MRKTKQAPKNNIIELAEKRRHIALVEKASKGKPLSAGELRELQKFEGDKIPVGVVDTQELVAKSFKVSERSVRNWIKEGMPKRPAGGYDLMEIQAWKFARAGGGSVTEKGKHEASYRKYKALLAELEYKKQLGRLIALEDVERGRVERILTIKKGFLALPARVAPQLIGLEVKAIKAILTKRVTEILREFAK